MRPTKLLKELRLRRVQVQFIADGQGAPLRLHFRAPTGVFTARLKVEVRRHKHSLLRLLAAEEREERPASAGKHTAPQPTSTCAWREVLRPDLREPLELEALDADPPEPPPHPRLVWVRDLGCWQDGNVIVSTVATREARDCYHQAKASWRKDREEACIRAMLE